MDKAHGLGRGVIAAATVILGVVPCAFALDPSLGVSQYAHTAWTVREGFSEGTIDAMAQTKDGYLWLGSEFGLLRFDGVKNVPWQPPDGQRLPSTYVRTLLAGRDGSLWIGTAEGLASWRDGKLTRFAEFAGQSVDALIEDRDGVVWAGGQAAPRGKLCAIQSGKAQCYGEDGSFGQYVESLLEDGGRNLWVGAMTGLWRWKPGLPQLHSIPDEAQALMEGDGGALVIATRSGIRQFVAGKADSYPLPASGRKIAAVDILRDRDGGVWVGTTDRGLVHVHQGRTDVFERSDGLTGDFIKKIFEDREGSIWVATLDGLDRFRDLAIPTISVKQGLSNATVESVLVARDGSVWLGTTDGLNQWNNGQVTIYRKGSAKATGRNGEPVLGGLSAGTETGRANDVREIPGSGLPDDAIQSLFQDSQDRIWVSTRGGLAFLENGRFTRVQQVAGGVHSIAGDRAGNVWVSQTDSLFRLRNGRVVEEIPWARLGRHDGARSLVADPVRGGLWIGMRDGGVAYFEDGQVKSFYTSADGLGEGHVRDLQVDREGTLWASTEGGLSRLTNGRFRTLTSKNGLPCDAVHWVMEDNAGDRWLYLACGLVRLARQDLDGWFAAADQKPERRVRATIFDNSDGVRSHSTTTGFSPSVARSTDGKLYFLPWDGVSVIDPRHLHFNSVPPPVQIEEITADRRTYHAASGAKEPLPLPPLIRDLKIDYTALSLVAPEKVLFRYKLEPWDAEWQEVGTRRHAIYNNLSPAKYSFRVSACNNSGVWNDAGTVLAFSVAPAYYQTVWFRVVCAAALLAVLAALYQLRLRQVARQFHMLLEERVRERTRIAHELHDTLLQGFLGASMLVHVAIDGLSEDSQVKPILLRSVARMGQVIDEGRNALRGLRASMNSSLELDHAFSQVPEELGPQGREDVEFRVVVDGRQRPLLPAVRDEVYRIGREALLNAFRHSQASHIEIELRYSEKELRVIVRDDGSGIDPNVVHAGRDGHWGLSGMRERADQIGARFHVASRASAGTEIELTVPAHVAFPGAAGRRRRMARQW